MHTFLSVVHSYSTCVNVITFMPVKKYGSDCADFHETPKGLPVLSAYHNSYMEFNTDQGINAESRHRNSLTPVRKVGLSLSVFSHNSKS